MNTITIELSAEDRARLDAILAALEKSPSCDKCVQDVTAALMTAPVPQTAPQSEEKESVDAQTQNEDKPILEETTEAPPWEDGVPEAAPKHSKADLQHKVVTMVAAGADKAKVRGVINEYAQRVSLVPEDKVDEVLEKLEALEG